MTLEEAIKIGKTRQECLRAQNDGRCKYNLIPNYCIKGCEYNTSNEEYDKFETLAIKVLEQLLHDDIVSKHEVLEALDKHKYSNEFCEEHHIDQSINLDMAHIIINGLPPVIPIPKEKTAKWIKIQSGDKMFPEIIVCSNCNNENSHLDFNEHVEAIGKVFIKSKYCPNCGRKMVNT